MSKMMFLAIFFNYWAEILKSVGLELLEFTPGIYRWKIKCIHCNAVYEKVQLYTGGQTRPMACKFCKDDPDGYAEAYLVKVFCEKSGAHSKFGLSKDPSNRIASFGSTLTDTTWPNLITSIGRKIEDQVAEKFGMYKTFPEELIGNGWTECYNPLVHEQIKEYVYQLLLDAKSSIPQNIS